MSKRKEDEFLEERLAATLAESESLQLKANTALESAEQVWWVWDLATGRLTIHAPGECILGYPHEDMEQPEQFWWDRIHPEDLPEVKETLEAAMHEPGRIWKCEHRFRDVTGDWVYVEQTGFVHSRDAEGNPVEMMGITRKTQERYQLLDLFRGSETLIDAMVDSAPVAFWVRDSEGTILLCSWQMEESFGPVDSLQTIEKLTSPGQLMAWREAYHAALRDECVKRKMTMCFADGSRSQVEHHLIPLTQETETFAILEVFKPC